MIDRRSKKFIKWLSKRLDYQFMYYDEYPDEFGTADELFAMIRFLSNKGLIDIIRDQNDRSVGVELSHISIRRKEFKYLATIEYLKRNWIAILALIISLLSLIGAYQEELTSIIQTIKK